MTWFPHSGDAFGALMASLCVLVTTVSLGLLWRVWGPQQVRRYVASMVSVSLIAAVAVFIISYIANVTWS